MKWILNGKMQIIWACFCLCITKWYCSLKTQRAYGGSDWDFLVHSAKVDGDVYAWLVFGLWTVEIFLILYGINKILKKI